MFLINYVFKWLRYKEINIEIVKKNKAQSSRNNTNIFYHFKCFYIVLSLFKFKGLIAHQMEEKTRSAAFRLALFSLPSLCKHVSHRFVSLAHTYRSLYFKGISISEAIGFLDERPVSAGRAVCTLGRESTPSCSLLALWLHFPHRFPHSRTAVLCTSAQRECWHKSNAYWMSQTHKHVHIIVLHTFNTTYFIFTFFFRYL